MPKQTSITATAIIPAPPERVWEIAYGNSRYPELVENTLRMIHVDGPARLGATMEELTRIAGPWKSVTQWRVTQFDPPRRQVQAGEGVTAAKDMAVIIELSPAEVPSLVRSTGRPKRFAALVTREYVAS
jgi:hypothetical protein